MRIIKIPGEDFEDSWVTDKFMTWYLYDTGGAGYETFETLLKAKATENGLSPDFTSSEEKSRSCKIYFHGGVTYFSS